MASTSLESVLTPQFLKGLRDFWFEHFESQDAYILPGQKEMLRWFQGGKELDEICV